MHTVDVLKRNNVHVLGNLAAPETLVFVHGFGTDQSIWTRVAEHFLPHYRVVLLDNVGAGASEPAAFVQHRYLNLRQYADDLLEVLAALEVKGVVAVGHSAGAMTCLLAAVKEPSRFERLVLIAASPRYRDDHGYVGGLNDEGIQAIYRRIAADHHGWAESFGQSLMPTTASPDAKSEFIASLKKIPKDRTLTVLCSILQSDHRSSVPQLAKPTLVIQTSRDDVVPLEVAQYLQRHIPGSTLRVIDAEGHLPHMTAAGEVIRAMDEFLGKRLDADEGSLQR